MPPAPPFDQDDTVPELYRIGEFARASGLSVKALRHYDRVGLLIPTRTDPRTGYRYYEAGQLAVVEEIRGLVRLGLPLARVRELLGGAPPVSLRAALLTVRASIEDRLRADRQRLAAIEARLALLERVAPASEHRVFLSSQPARVVGTLRHRLTSFADADELLVEAMGALPGAVAGVIWHDCGKTTGTIDCEGLVGLPDHRAALPPRSRRVRLRRLPAVTTACIVHCGSDATISAAYASVWSWIERRGLVPAGPVREWYLQGASDGPEAVSEIHVPIARPGGGA